LGTEVLFCPRRWGERRGRDLRPGRSVSREEGGRGMGRTDDFEGVVGCAWEDLDVGMRDALGGIYGGCLRVAAWDVDFDVLGLGLRHDCNVSVG
jgi:hypothetical protein